MNPNPTTSTMMPAIAEDANDDEEQAREGNDTAAGTRRYLTPDLETTTAPQPQSSADQHHHQKHQSSFRRQSNPAVLSGLQREISMRLKETSGGGDAPSLNYSDYLRAQRALRSERNININNLPPTVLSALRPSIGNNSNHDPAVGVDEVESPAAAALNPAMSEAVAAAVARMRRRMASVDSGTASRSRASALNMVNAARRADDDKNNNNGDNDAQVSKRPSLTQQQKSQFLLQLDESEREGADWDAIFEELEVCDQDGHFEGGGHDDVLPWYSPPIQRQRWDKDQILPHVNWGDLFFDLFYVAAAYNLGVMLTTAMNKQNFLRGILYYLGTFGPLWISWETSMIYSSRYTSVDYAHRLFEVVRYLFVAQAVVHITGVDRLGDPGKYDALIFTVAVLGETLMHLLLNTELLYRGQGETGAIRNHTKVHIKHAILPTALVYAAAVAAAAVLVMRAEGGDYGDEAHRNLVTAADYGTDRDAHAAHNYGHDAHGDGGYATESAAGYAKYGDGYGAKPPIWELSDLPLTLTAIGYLQNIVISTISNAMTTNGKFGDIRERFVPNNADYVIHRYGEWILLMIGEGILSLLIVETAESRDYYIITFFGVLTVIFIQILKFESEPAHAECHAVWKTFANSMCYSYLIQVLSMGLIVFGVTYKVFLYDVVDDAAKDEEYGYGGDEEAHHRRLAGAPAITDAASANVFSGSLTVVVISLELMCLTHCGIKRAFGHLVRRKEGEYGKFTAPHTPIVVIALFKVGIFAFTVTLSQWTTDAATLTVCGFCIILALSVTRIGDYFFIHKKEMIQELTETILSNAARASIMGALSVVTQSQSERANDASVASNYGPVDSARHKPKSVGGSDRSTKSARDGTKSKGGISSAARSSFHGDADLTSSAKDSFDGVIIADLNGIITQVNDTAVTLFGYATKVEMIGKNLNILVGGSHGKRHDGYIKAFKKRVSTDEKPEHKVLGRQRMLQACKADGTEFPCIVGIKMVSNHTKIAGYIRDMSGVVSKDKNSAISAMENIVHDHTFDAIIATNGRGIIQKVNKQAVIELGYESREELIGMNISILINDLINQPDLLSRKEQRVLEVTRKDGTDTDCIIASKKVQGADNLFVLHVRNLDPVKASLKASLKKIV